MDTSILFLYIVFGISIVIYVATIIITLILVIPMQAKELKVNDGLRTLRMQMIFKGVLSLIVATASILALTSRFIFGTGDLLRYVITSIIFIHALSLFLQSYIDYRIYHQDYKPKPMSDDSKKIVEIRADVAIVKKDVKTVKKGMDEERF